MKKRSVTFPVLSIMIPLISVAVWCQYYAIDQTSLLNLLRMMLPVCVGMYIIGEFIFWAFLSKVKPSFRFGFWWGVFIFAPFYIFQISFNAGKYIGKLPTPALYTIYLGSGLVAALAFGFITWSIFGLIFQSRNAKNPLKMAVSRLFLIIICLAVLLPMAMKNRAAQPDLVAKRISYRAFVERELEQPLAHRVAVLGIDGGDWDVIKPLVDEGKLPNLKKLMGEGRWGVLESVKPMRSPTLWTTIFTGQPSKKHGIEDWNVSYSKNRLMKAVWNILSEYDLRSTLINIPCTFPPEEIVGKEISGFPYPNITLNANGWILSTEAMQTSLTPFALLDKTMDSEGNFKGEIVVNDVLIDFYNAKMKGKVFKNMALEYILRTELSAIYGNRIPVAKFKYVPREKRIEISPSKGEASAIATIGENEWSNFFMVPLGPSMVGVAKIRALSLNDEDFTLYMTPFYQPSDNPKHPYTFPPALAKDITQLINEDSNNNDQYIVEMTWMSAQDDHITFPAILEILEYEADKKAQVSEYLFGEAQWDFFAQNFTLTDRLQHPTWAFRYNQYEPQDLANSEDGAKIIDLAKSAIETAYLKTDKWIGSLMKHVDPGKDIILVVSDHGFTRGTGREENIGVHRQEGIYLVWGEPVKGTDKNNYKNNEGEKKSILDVTPNILYLLGLPVGKDMPGKLWSDLYDDEYESLNPPSEIDTYNKEEAVKGSQQKVDPAALEQIKGLGYLDGANLEGN